MAMTPRKKALLAGLDFYATGKPCKNGHVTARRTLDAHCVECNLIRGRERIARDPQANRDKVRAWNEKNPGRNQKRCAEWLASHMDFNKQKCRERYHANPDAARAEKRRSYWLYVDERRADSKRWRANNMEKAAAIVKAWRAKNPEKRREYGSRRRAALRAAEGRITAQEIEAMIAAQKGLCIYCKADGRLTLDHIIPLARGGSHTRENAQMICARCNSRKGAKDPIEFAQSQGFLL